MNRPMTKVDVDAPPQRLLARVVAEFGLEVIGAWVEALGDLKSALVFQGVNLANTEYLLTDTVAARAHGRDGPPDHLRRPIRVHALAQSLGLSPETARRVVLRLEADGLCERRDAGVAIAPAALENARIRAAEDLTLSSFVRELKVLDELGWRPSPITAPGGEMTVEALAPWRHLVLLNIQDYVYRSALEMIPMFSGDYAKGLIFMAILADNIRQITYDRQLSWDYATAGAPPPDDLREAVSIRSVGVKLGFAPETTRRYVNSLLREGLCVRTDNGVVIPVEVLTRQEFVRSGLDMHMWFLAMLKRLDRSLNSAG
jgi:DNA-binding IclR family transcriptional regulator